MGKKMHFIPKARAGGTSGHQADAKEELICPNAPRVRFLPLLREPPLLFLSESVCMSFSPLSFDSDGRDQKVSSSQSYKLSSAGDKPVWIIEFMKIRKEIDSNSKRPAAHNIGKKQAFPHSVSSYLVDSKGLMIRRGHKRHI